MFETLEHLQSVRADVSPLQAALIKSEAEDRADAARSEREAEAKRAAAAERAEVMAIQNHILGDPLGGLSSARSALAEANDEVAELSSKLEKARNRQERARSNIEFFSSRAQIATDASFRSVPQYRDPVEQACMRAQIALDDHEREQRHILERAKAQVRSRRLAAEQSIGVKPDGTVYYR
jgi:hypothetical protein